MGAEHRVHPVPEPAGLPQPAGLRVPDGGDGDGGVAGELRLGQAYGAPPGGEAGRQGAGGGRQVPLSAGPRAPGDARPRVAARPGNEHPVPDERAQRPAAGQRGVPGDPAERRAARRGLPRPERAVGDLAADRRGHPGPLGLAPTGGGHGAGVTWSVLGCAASMPLLVATARGELRCRTQWYSIALDYYQAEKTGLEMHAPVPEHDVGSSERERAPPPAPGASGAVRPAKRGARGFQSGTGAVRPSCPQTQLSAGGASVPYASRQEMTGLRSTPSFSISASTTSPGFR